LALREMLPLCFGVSEISPRADFPLIDVQKDICTHANAARCTKKQKRAV